MFLPGEIQFGGIGLFVAETVSVDGISAVANVERNK
jgi:hypothetical protein